MTYHEQQQSKLPKKGETEPHEEGVLRLKELAEKVGYEAKKDHIVWSTFGEQGRFFAEHDPNDFFDKRNQEPIWRLDLVLRKEYAGTAKTYNFIWAEVDGWRHEKKTTKAKDNTKIEDVLKVLRRFDPFHIRFKLYVLIGKYQWSDECLKQVLERPWKYHLKTIA